MEDMSTPKIGIKIFNWIFCIYCLFAFTQLGFSVGTIIWFIVGIVSLPIKGIRELWKKVPIQKSWVKPVVLGIVFFIAAMLVPQADYDKVSNDEVVVEETTKIDDTTTIVENDENSTAKKKEPIEESSLIEETTTLIAEPEETTSAKEMETTTEEVTVESITEIEESATVVEPIIETESEPIATIEETTTAELNTEATTETPTVQETTTAEITTEETTTEAATETTTSGTGAYAVNGSNGKIHIVGECSATGNDSNAMNYPIYFNTYEEAEEYSKKIAPSLEKRKCGNCW